MRRARHGNIRGFTLLEMLVALAVFAVLGVMSSKLLSDIIQTENATSERRERLAEVQRAMLLMQRDMLQISHRPVRDELGDPVPPLRIGEALPIELTRHGWRNPLALPRSELQRIAYVLEDDTLYRYYWNVLDRAEDSEPVRQALLHGVERIEFTAVDVSGNEHAFWPLIGELQQNPDNRLVLIGVQLQVAPFGELVRVWDVPSI